MGTTTFSGPVASPGGFVTVTSAGVASAGIYSGAGAPTSVTAAKGSLYMNVTASTAATRLYVNTDGGTTWAAFTAAS